MKWSGVLWDDFGRAKANNIWDFCATADGSLYLSASFNGPNGTYPVAKFNSNATAIQNNVSSTQLSFYPNPASSGVTFDANEGGLLQVYNLTGELMLTQ